MTIKGYWRKKFKIGDRVLLKHKFNLIYPNTLCIVYDGMIIKPAIVEELLTGKVVDTKRVEVTSHISIDYSYRLSCWKKYYEDCGAKIYDTPIDTYEVVEKLGFFEYYWKKLIFYFKY